MVGRCTATTFLDASLFWLDFYFLAIKLELPKNCGLFCRITPVMNFVAHSLWASVWDMLLNWCYWCCPPPPVGGSHLLQADCARSPPPPPLTCVLLRGWEKSLLDISGSVSSIQCDCLSMFFFFFLSVCLHLSLDLMNLVIGLGG